ncbi:MAG: heat-inducible transcription repressor HrcA [Ignavibacteria bacterium]|jgi:heat-inducible transcriptional repressor|nr:heat-inducible transcription repressor HrcA [Ignavibacteria bacterium]MCU7499109.1 heat-inducible transcription repressor HrcA [Ignavibacteria bacterium]MCU7513994.1 heat-inducible transcription repressor HrcA [Ignavibacteria bacterium]MCU7521536.1 heat-inducible transcription repressor HrcA [Ignavibacteria bacterium]MCU7525913.1 heat-inducible transcription repressor HrcA [Ignavibacteria bacterium]
MDMEPIELSDREKTILRNIIQQFVLTANPVGSSNLTKQYGLGLSSATIRNIMADLEEAGYLNHPHTSAGRVPTDKGYRFFVNSLMEPPLLKEEEKETIMRELKMFMQETDDLIQVTSALLSDITNQLAMVTYPKLDTGRLEKLQIVQLTSSRILVVVSIKSGLVKTITLEINAEFNGDHIEAVQRLLNERLSGLTLSEIKRTIGERFRDISENYRPIIRVFLDSADRIFTGFERSDRAIITGAKNILRQPEFEKHELFQSVIELIEDKDVIVHILNNKVSSENDLVIKIGSENESERLTDYSLITKDYTIGDVSGTIGIVGPRRMQYSKMIASIVYVAEVLSEYMKKGNK